MRCQHLVTQPVLTFSSHSKNGNLVVLDGFGSREAVGSDVLEVLGQCTCTFCEPALRDNQEEDTAWHDPSPCVPQKHQFHPLIFSLAHFGVVRRIEIDKGQAVHPALNFQCVAVHHINAKCPRLLSPVCVEFNAVRQCGALGDNRVKCCAVSDTRIERGKRLFWKGKMCS